MNICKLLVQKLQKIDVFWYSKTSLVFYSINETGCVRTEKSDRPRWVISNQVASELILPPVRTRRRAVSRKLIGRGLHLSSRAKAGEPSPLLRLFGRREMARVRCPTLPCCRWLDPRTLEESNSIVPSGWFYPLYQFCPSSSGVKSRRVLNNHGRCNRNWDRPKNTYTQCGRSGYQSID
jgi:hypothetical protein